MNCDHKSSREDDREREKKMKGKYYADTFPFSLSRITSTHHFLRYNSHLNYSLDIL